MTLPTRPDGLRPVRSFHQRRGKITPTQQRGLDLGLAKFAVAPESVAELQVLLAGRSLVLDIGFGMGESVVHLAQLQPELGIVGLEVHERGVGQLLATLIDTDIDNVRVVCTDAAEFVRDLPARPTFTEVRMFFPDPWPKARHHKRRLLQPTFAREISERLVPGGLFHLATDWSSYAEHMDLVLAAEPLLEARPDLVPACRARRPTTRYEKIGIDRGHVVTDLVYSRAR